MENDERPATAVSPFLSRMLKHPILTAEQELKLARRVKKGDTKAIDELIRHNLRSVMAAAQRFRGYGIDIDDLFQMGVIGLRKAILKFDPERGYRLSTYSGWWIRQTIHRYCQENSRLIRLPTNVWIKMHGVRKKQRAAEADPDDRKAADELAADPHLEWIREVLSREPISLDQMIETGDGNKASLYDILPDASTSSTPADQTVDARQRAELVRQALTELAPREQDVLDRRFRNEQTLADIGADYGVSRERIRQIEAEALRKLSRLLQEMLRDAPI